jgi:DNA-binding response OmpR family regulator
MTQTPTVLVVDDEVNIANFIKDFLEENGFSVAMAHNGKDGLKYAVEQLPDVILLDVELPDMDGYSICREMRAKSSLRNKPILMLTVRNDQQNELTGLRAGADDYLTKPIDTARLLARLNSAIHRNIRELDASPLTHLPGNTSIAQELERLLQEKQPFAVIYGDLNNFKSFNDRYGFLRGDQAIKLASQCFVTAVETRADMKPAFIGHIGGDDFVAIVHPDEAEKVCEDIIRGFDEKVPNLYDEADRKKGFILGKTRQGQMVENPIMGIALVVVKDSDRPFEHPAEISALASELKVRAKGFVKSAFVMERRKLGRG